MEVSHMAEKQVKVYSTPTCPWCKRAKQFLDTNHIKYQELNVAEDKIARDEMISLTHQMAVPTIAIDGEFVIGYNEKTLKEKLEIK
jgi:glutaredoxin 3